MTNQPSHSSDAGGGAGEAAARRQFTLARAFDPPQTPALSQGMDQLPLLLTIKDFLRWFRIGRTSFYQEVKSGRLKIVKFGKATRICRTDADAWLSALPSPPLGPRPLAPPSGKPRKGSEAS